MAEQKQFKISGKTFYTQELTIEQDELIAGVLQEVGIDSITDIRNVRLDNLLGAIREKRLLRRALSILLIPVNEVFDENNVDAVSELVKKATNTQVKAVLQDFLAKNPELQGLWSSISAPETPKEMTDIATDTSR